VPFNCARSAVLRFKRRERRGNRVQRCSTGRFSMSGDIAQGNGVMRRNGKVTPAGPHEAQRPTGLHDLQPLAFERQGGSDLILPADDILATALVEANTHGQLPQLQKLVSAWEEVAKRCNLAHDEMVRLAEFRLTVERKLGEHLSQNVHRGGNRSKSGVRTLPRTGGLPAGITRNQSSAYQALAAIPLDVFRSYLDGVRQAGKVPSLAGARRFALMKGHASFERSKPLSGRRGREFGVPQQVVEVVRRLMTPDVLVGDARITALKKIAESDGWSIDKLSGDVFIAHWTDPLRCIRELEAARCQARIHQAVLLLPAEVWSNWFHWMTSQSFDWIFLRDVRDSQGVGRMLVHVGGRAEAFRAAVRSVIRGAAVR